MCIHLKPDSQSSAGVPRSYLFLNTPRKKTCLPPNRFTTCVVCIAADQRRGGFVMVLLLILKETFEAAISRFR